MIALAVALVLLAGPAATNAGQDRLDANYSQGVARVAGGWIFTGNHQIWRTDERFTVVTTNATPIPADWRDRGFNHVGDPDVAGRYLYAPLEQPDFDKGQQAMLRYDPTTLQFVDAVTVPQHEASFVAVDPSSMTAYSMDRFDGDVMLRYHVQGTTWTPLAPLRMSRVLHHTQGADVDGGSLYISTADDHNGLYRVDLHSGRVDELGDLGHPGEEGEGIDATPLPTGLLHTMTSPRSGMAFFDHWRVTGLPRSSGSGAWIIVAIAGGGAVLAAAAFALSRRRTGAVRPSG